MCIILPSDGCSELHAEEGTSLAPKMMQCRGHLHTHDGKPGCSAELSNSEVSNMLLSCFGDQAVVFIRGHSTLVAVLLQFRAGRMCLDPGSISSLVFFNLLSELLMKVVKADTGNKQSKFKRTAKKCGFGLLEFAVNSVWTDVKISSPAVDGHI